MSVQIPDTTNRERLILRTLATYDGPSDELDGKLDAPIAVSDDEWERLEAKLLVLRGAYLGRSGRPVYRLTLRGRAVFDERFRSATEEAAQRSESGPGRRDW